LFSIRTYLVSRGADGKKKLTEGPDTWTRSDPTSEELIEKVLRAVNHTWQDDQTSVIDLTIDLNDSE